MSGIELYNIHNFNGLINNHKIEYKFYSLDKESYRAKILGEVVLVSTNIVFEYLKHNNIVFGKCNHNHSLSIYEISSDELNNNIRFSKARYYPNSSYIYGFWEPTANYNDVIVASHFGSDNLFVEIISHEVAHYWYNRLNLSRFIEASHEEFALMVEDMYKRR